MSKNYTNYSKPNYMSEPAVEVTNEEATEVTAEVVAEVAEEVIEQSKETVETEDHAEEPVEPTEPKTVTGTVNAPKPKLNVRRQPFPTGKVIGVINNGSKVKIDLINSTTEWYKVISESGLEGYCMKEFIEVK